MKCEVCGRANAWRCPACGRVACPDHGVPGCPTCGRGVRAAPSSPRETRTTVEPPAPLVEAGERVCSICGAPAAEACVRCGSWYCVKHRGVDALPDEPFEEGEEGPRICWNCRLSINARTVLFWTIATAVCIAVLVVFLFLWA